MTDLEAWETYPQHRWVYNKLDLYRRLGYLVAPHGFKPSVFPVVSKPIMNLWGMGIGVKEWRRAADVEYKAGYLWMERFTGTWVSWDIEFSTQQVYIAEVTDGSVIDACPFKWRVNKGLMFMIPKPILKQIAELELDKLGIDRINVETIGDNIVEVHLRWSHEIERYYDLVPFDVYVHWKDVSGSYYGAWNGSKQDGDIDHRFNEDDLAEVLTSEDRPYRIRQVIHPLGENDGL